MSKKSLYWGIVFSVILSGLIFILGLDRKTYTDHPVTVYQVYLNGEAIGVIEDEDELYNLIDKEQRNLKSEYNVDKIYAPLGLETTKLVTYEGKIDNVVDIYDKIKDVEPFTIKGYEIKIIRSEDDIKTINVLKKEDFDSAIDNTIKAFVDEEKYEKYLTGTQDKITTTGSTIEDISIRENITIKEKYLSTEEKIFTDNLELSRYLLFGTNEPGGTHIVKNGETIAKIAEDYELNVKEFLLVNPTIISENALLFSGQVVNIALINPLVSVVVRDNIIEDKVVSFRREVRWDTKYPLGTTFTETVGQNGLTRAEYYTETINGTIAQVSDPKTTPIIEVVNEVVVKGGLSSGNIGEGDWVWPTQKPYIITSYFGWRTDPISFERAYHRGIDISGTGYGSDIYAALGGEITKVGYSWDMGNHVYINHGNGVQTIYMHLSDFAPETKVGKQVYSGELIGYMGTSGYSTGTHLDFRIINNGVYIDPLTIIN